MLVGPSGSLELVITGVFVYVDRPVVSIRTGLMSTSGKNTIDDGDIFSLFPSTGFVGEDVNFVEAREAFVRKSHSEKYVEKP